VIEVKEASQKGQPAVFMHERIKQPEFFMPMREVKIGYKEVSKGQSEQELDSLTQAYLHNDSLSSAR
jgi:hypothetical protein